MSAQHTSGGDVQSRPLKAANDGSLLCTAGLISGLIRPLPSNCSQFQSFSSYADARSNSETTIGSLCSSLEPFRAASNCWRSISYHTSTWTSPQPPASSCASERGRCPDLSMQICSAAASRTPPRLRGQFRSLSALPSQLLRK
jgi:hypothetical protein